MLTGRDDDALRDLAGFSGRGYVKGRAVTVQVLWMLASGTLVQRWWCPSSLRVRILRLFGAVIGENVLIRHRVRIHWPWKLTIGSNSWVGEGVWILNLEPVVIGANVCLSQEAFLCTGSHDRRSATFEFDNAPIAIGSGVWIAARVTVLRGVNVGAGATVGATCVVSRDVSPGALLVAPSPQVREE